jgi:hypothetical protein
MTPVGEGVACRLRGGCYSRGEVADPGSAVPNGGTAVITDFTPAPARPNREVTHLILPVCCLSLDASID